MNDYDRVAYPSMAHPQTFAENLAIKGFLRGLDVAPPDRCRVLELGCGDGFNLATMAVIHPDAHYTGIDYSADSIERGRKILTGLNLSQVRLEAADIRALPAEFGEFDYIIAHGVYSWVPSDVRDALLAVISRNLAPHGVAFVSYLALPGAYMRETVRSIVRFHTRAVTDPKGKVLQARAVLQTVTRATAEPNIYSQWLTAELDLIEKHTDEGFFHDELSEISAPVLFTEFLDHAAKHRLQFFSEAEYLLPVGRFLTEEARTRLRPLEANRVLLEQYLDFIEGRRFRQTLLCKPGLGTSLATERLDTLHIHLRAKPATATTNITGDEPTDYHGEKKAILRAKTPAEKAALLVLSSTNGRTLSYAQLITAVQRRAAEAGVVLGDGYEPALRKFIIHSGVPGLIDFSWGRPAYATTTPQRPQANPLVHWMLAQNSPQLANLTGQFVEIDDPLGRFLLSRLDGTRDHAALLTDIRAFLAQAHATAKAEGQPPPALPQPDAPTLSAQLTNSLQGLTQLGFFFATLPPA